VNLIEKKGEQGKLGVALRAALASLALEVIKTNTSSSKHWR
jgi:hypothetical protein